MGNTPYELWKNKKPNILYFYSFGCSCFILNTIENLNKFSSKAQSYIMLGYSKLSKGYRVWNTKKFIVDESIHVRFDDKIDPEKSKRVEKL